MESELRTATSANPGSLKASGTRRALAGFFLVGMLLSVLAAILPAWGYHISTNYILVGNYFISLNLGVLIGARLGYSLVSRKGISFTMALGCGLAAFALFLLAACGPPASAWWRVLGFFLVGGGAGLADTGIFQALASSYEHDRAATINISGTLLGLGCLLTTLLVAGTFYVYTVASTLFLLGVVPAFFALSYAKSPLPEPTGGPAPSFREALAEFRHPGAVLFMLLLFFQFGNEWSVAGWLPLFLVQRLGISPELALLMLSFYWLCLIVGRLAAQVLLPRIRHGRFLMGSVLLAMFGCFILASTNNCFGAWSGIFFLGAGFASIFPLVVEKIGFRFPSYHPALFNSVVSLALTGGLLANGSLGYWVELWGIGVVMLLPLFGTIMVFVLLLSIWLEGKLSGGSA